MTIKEVTLPDNTVTDNYSEKYQRYCEAKHLSRKSLYERREFLDKIRHHEKRVEDLKYWLSIIFKRQSSDQQ